MLKINVDEIYNWIRQWLVGAKPLSDPTKTYCQSRTKEHIPVKHDDVMKWKHFPHYWPLCGEFTGPQWTPRTKGQWRGALMFSLIYVWISPLKNRDWSFDVFFDLRLNKGLSKQSWGWWFETQSRSLWRHCNVHMRDIFKYIFMKEV